MEKLIYLDNAATTAMYPECAEIFARYGVENFYNPSALYKQASDTANDVKGAREFIKRALNAPDGEFYFTSGGTESDNTAIFCAVKNKKGRIIVSEGEHDAIISSAKEMKNRGYDVEFAPINADGSIKEDEFIDMLDKDVALVSIMHVSNETGAVNNIKKLAKAVRKYSPSALFHSDGVQAFCNIKVNLRDLDVDMYSVSGHKIHAHKGIGGLFVKKGAGVKPLIYGGGQEKGFRSGTESTSGIMAFRRAVELGQENFDANYSKKRSYIEYLKAKLCEYIDDIQIISPENNCAPHVLSVAFGSRVRGEVMLHSLEKHGILVGIGSACSSHHESRFKQLLGLDDEHRDGVVRFSVSEFNDINEVEYVVSAVKTEYETLKSYSRK